MPYTPYTLQTILSSVKVEEPIPTTTSSTSFFSRRPTSPPNNEARILRFSIDSVGAWDSDLYCGTSDGLILHYSLEDNADKSIPFKTKLENTINLGFGKKSVDRILLVPQVSKAVVLCDSTLLFFTLPFFEAIPSSFIQPIKGVSCFSHDIGQEDRIGDDGTVELIVVKRRAIQIYKIGESMHLKKELPLAEGALTLTRHGRTLCLADTMNYKLINLQQSSVTLLIPTPQVPINSPSLLGGTQLVPKPLVAVVKQDEFLVVSGSPDNQTIGIFVNSNGDAIRGTLQWSSYPKAICVEFPYVAALLLNQKIEIHNIMDQTLLQVMSLDMGVEANGMSFGHGIKVWMDVLAQKLRRSVWPPQQEDEELHHSLQRQVTRYSTAAARILIYGKDSVLAQVTTPLVVQVDSLLQKNLVEEAVQLAEQARNTMSSDHNVYMERLRSELNYTFQKAGLFLLKSTLFDDAFTLLTKGEMDPRLVIHLFEGLAQPKWLTESPPVLLFDEMRVLVEKMGTIKDIVMESLKEFGNENNNDGGAPEMKRVLLMNAREALKKYLLTERHRRKDRLGQNDTISKVIDTSLLKIYMSQKDDHAIHQLLKQLNDCSTEDCSKALLKANKYYALSILYESKHEYEKVLELWTKMHTGELPDEEFKDGLFRIKRILLKDISQEELPLSVIMHYAWWLTDQDPGQGVEVFTRSPRMAEMDPDEIITKLERYNNEGVRTYLEYLVLSQKSDHAEYHTRLACSYVRDVANEMGDQMEELVKGFQQHVKPEATCTFVGYLGTLKPQTQLVRLRLLLIRLLLKSPLYSPETLLDTLSKAGPLDIEKAIVYGRMGKHKESLEILIHQLGDFVGAETYCVTNGQSTGVVPAEINDDRSHQTTPARSSSLAVTKPLPPVLKELLDEDELSLDDLLERRTLFSMLFKTYIGIKEPDLMVARTMHLLNTQGFYLDTVEILEMIPEDWSVEMLQEFLIRSLRRSLDDYNESQIVLGLGRGENLMVSSDLIKLYNEIGSIHVDTQTACLKCHRTIGHADFVRESKHGQLLHTHCAKLLGWI